MCLDEHALDARRENRPIIGGLARRRSGGESLRIVAINHTTDPPTIRLSDDHTKSLSWADCEYA